jgi:hypothetical protein
MEAGMSKTLVSMRFDDGLLEVARKAAGDDNRSLSNLAETALAEKLGYEIKRRPRRLQVLAPEGVESLRGMKVRPEPGDTPETLALEQALFERLLDIAEAQQLTEFVDDPDDFEDQGDENAVSDGAR